MALLNHRGMETVKLRSVDYVHSSLGVCLFSVIPTVTGICLERNSGGQKTASEVLVSLCRLLFLRMKSWCFFESEPLFGERPF